MTHRPRPRRWPAWALALLLCGYALGKAVFAARSRLGFPGGPPVTDAETADYLLDPAVGQWFAVATGVAGAVVAIATVTSRGRRLPRWLLLPMLAVMAASIAGGGGIMALDGFVGLGVGWSRLHGVVGLAAIVLCLETIRSYLAATRRRTSTVVSRGRSAT